VIREDVASMRYDEKLAELILYVAERIQGDRTAGATKLNKYLYFADFSAVRKLGHPITGAEYQRLQHGPAPRRLPPVRDRLVRNGDARRERRPDALGYVHDDLISERKPRTELFSTEELAVVDEVIETLREMSATQLSELSHREAGWQLVDEGETIPYELAFVLAPDQADITPAIRSEGERLLSEYADRLS